MSTGQHLRKLSCRAIYQKVLQKAVLLSLGHNHELSLLTSNHTSFASRRLNPAGKRDFARPRESHGLGNESRVGELG